MRTVTLSIGVLVLATLLAGCPGTPQLAVPLPDSVLAQHAGRVGVAMNTLPKVDTAFPGASCLLCIAAASAANSSLTKQTQTLASTDVASFKGNVIEALKGRGFEVIEIAEPIDLGKLANARDKSVNHADKDFGSLKAKYSLDKLCVLEVKALGIERPYAAYVPTGDPRAMVHGRAYLVDLSTNAYDWYQPIDVNQYADGKWDEPPAYPGLTNAYFQAVERARDQYLGPFKP